MGAIPFWLPTDNGCQGATYSPDPWQTATIGGDRIPGQVTVSAKVQRKHDKKKPAGADGARLTTTGYQPAQVEIRVRVWTSAQWDELQALLPKLWPSVGKGPPKALDLYHPEAASLGISSVIIVGAQTPQKESIPGARLFVFTAEEFMPPKAKKSAVATPLASYKVYQGKGAAAADNTPPAPTGPASKYRPVNDPQAPSESADDLGP